MNARQRSSSAHVAKQRLKHDQKVQPAARLAAIKDQLPQADAETRLKLILELDELSTDAALETLAGLLLDPDPTIAEALRTILCRPHPRYTQVLHRAASSGTPENRLAALHMIALDRSPHHVTLLAACLDDAQPASIQDVAAQILQAIQTPEAVDIVTEWRQRRFHTQAEERHAQFAHTESPPTRAMTVAASGAHQLVNHRRSLSSLISHVRSGVWHDQQDAAKAVQQLIKVIAADPCADYAAIRQDFIDAANDAEYMVRWVAVEALARLGDPEGVPALVQRLEDRAWTIRVAAIRALIEIGDVAAVPVLGKMTSDPNTSVQEAAVEAIGIMGSLQDAPLLIVVVQNSPVVMVRLAAIEALRRLRAAQAIPALLALLDEGDPVLRWHAALALSELADKRSVPVLINHLHDKAHPRWEEKRVCDWLVDALLRINTPVARVAVKQWKQASV